MSNRNRPLRQELLAALDRAHQARQAEPQGDTSIAGSTWRDLAGRSFTLIEPVNDDEAICAYDDGAEGRMSLRGCVQIASPTGWT